MQYSDFMVRLLLVVILNIYWIDPAIASQTIPNTSDQEPAQKQCRMTQKEKRFAELLINHPDQKHLTLTCNPVLHKFAEARAKDLATREYFSHVTPENIGPNELLENLGYVLPDTYIHGRHNTIESIGGGIADPEKILEALLGSKVHKDHLLGLSKLYNEQNEFGIGFYYKEDSPLRYYWVIIIARQKNSSDKDYVCTPEPVTCISW